MKTRPRQLPDGGWLQVHLPSGAAAGYCAGHPAEPHATPEEAGQCYRKYLIEQTLNLDCTRPGSGRCSASGCKTVTRRTAVIDGQPHGYWCDRHRNRKTVTKWWNA